MEQPYPVKLRLVDSNPEARTPQRPDQPETTTRQLTNPTAPPLGKVAAFVERYVSLPAHASAPIAAWVAHAYAIDWADTTPYLAITSPEPRSGKTRLLEVLELLTPKPWRTVLPTPAVLFRKIDADAPTLLLDETDTIWRSRGSAQSLRAVLNAGYRRGATVPRVETISGQKVTVDYAVFCPKALAGIGTLPPTIADRSIHVRLQRRAVGEQIERYRQADAVQAAVPVVKRLLVWQAALTDATLNRQPQIPASLHDRAADNWEPLLAIAELAGGSWPKAMRQAAVVLSSQTDRDTSDGLQLLRDLRAIFTQTESDRVSTQDLLSDLQAIEESPWASMRLNPYKLASLLRPHNVKPQTLRLRGDGGLAKGYFRKDLDPVWERWLDAE